MSWQLGAFAVLAVALVGGFAWYEHSRPDARIVALVATLAAFAALGRIAFAALPNIKPTTDIVLISGYALGAGPGFVVGALAGLTSNFFFGQGPWTPWQMAGWGATGLIGAWLALAGGRRSGRLGLGRWPLAVVCTIVGFAFTALQDVGDWVNYSDHSTAQLAVYVGRGLGFDAVHAAGCLLFALAFGPALARSVGRFASRLTVTWQPPVGAAVLAVLACLSLGASAGMLGALWPAAPQSAQAAGGLQGVVAYLLRAQNPDGGLGAAPGQPSSELYAGWGALGLASAGVDPAGVSRDGHSLAGYLRASPPGDPGSLERTILALRAAGLRATDAGGTDLVSRLKAAIRPDGSVGEQTNLTAFAVLALRAAGVQVPARTLGWLAAQADGDGGFNFATAGGTSDADDTGAALEALAGDTARRAGLDRARAIAFLAGQQGADGGFPTQPGGGSNAQSTAWAVQGLLAAGGPAARIDRAIGYLRSLIASDGHVRYSRAEDQTPVWVTGESLMALERKPLPLMGRGGAPRGRRGAARGRAGRRAPVTPRESRGTTRFPVARQARAAPVSGIALAFAGDAGALAALALAPIGL